MMMLYGLDESICAGREASKTMPTDRNIRRASRGCKMILYGGRMAYIITESVLIQH